MQPMYYIGLDVHKRTISYCVKDGSGAIQGEGTLPPRARSWIAEFVAERSCGAIDDDSGRGADHGTDLSNDAGRFKRFYSYFFCARTDLSR